VKIKTWPQFSPKPSRPARQVISDLKIHLPCSRTYLPCICVWKWHICKIKMFFRYLKIST